LLHAAAGANPPNVEAARVVLQRGAVLGSLNSRGFSELHIAVMQNAVPLVKLLIASGADAAAMTKSGQSSFDLCQSLKLSTEMMSALEDSPSEAVFFAPSEDVVELAWSSGYGEMQKMLAGRRG
jgi:ankyrin repeat protein